jgi:hypothetical protein
MIDKLIERLQELSDEDMGVEEIVRAYEALQRVDDILDTITMSKRVRYRTPKEELPKNTSYGIKVKVVDEITWL